MRVVRLLAFFASIAILAAQTPAIGSNAPTQALQDLFLRSWYRDRFYIIVYPVPKTAVLKLGSTGLVQLFEDPGRAPELRYVLIKADLTQPWYVDSSTGVSTGDVYQVYPPLWTLLTSLNSTTIASPSQLNTTGFPVMDNDVCPPLDDGNGCMYVMTDKNYALFAYDHVLNAVLGGAFSVKDPLFTRWKSLGGVQGLGTAISGEQALTSGVTQSTANSQVFRKGQLFNITSGLNNGRLLTVAQPIYDYYLANGGPAQFLGLPVSDEMILANGRRRQSFEGGSIEYSPGGAVTVSLPVDSVNITDLASPLRLQVGESAKARVVLLAGNGTALSGRAVSWLTTNGRVAVAEPFDGGATIRAVGRGSASITAVSEGKSSYPLSVSVTAPCCQPGDGAPSSAISQAFEDAVLRNKLPLRLPGPSPVRRAGSGYVQEFDSAAAPPAPYLITVADAHVAGFYVTGAILDRYLALGGPPGNLGYPASDPNAAGRQLFEKKAALAGNPVQVVNGNILDRWAAGGYESGVLGNPVGAATPFTTFMATAGTAQTFAGGAILSGTAGPLSGRTVAVLGTFFARYATLGGPSGRFGMAMADETLVNGKRRQEFEGGFLEQQPGGDVTATDKQRRPEVSATPNPAQAGGKVRISVGGFPAGSELTIRAGSQVPFNVRTENGSYSWPVVIPVTAKSETVTVQASAAGGSLTASGSYYVRSIIEGQLRLNKVSGDNQAGLPGALALQPLKVALVDVDGNPVPGIQVAFQASPGASAQPGSAVTNSQGEAETYLRLPSSEAVALVTAAVPGRVVTFSAKSSSGSLANFPKLTQNLPVPMGRGPAMIAEKGSLLASVASILRFMQLRGDFPAVTAQIDVLGLNQYLTEFCVPKADGARICDGYLKAQRTGESLVNLWRAPGFVAGSARVSVETPSVETIRDLLGRGIPGLVGLNLSRNGAPAGSHFVAATGISSNGAIQIHDPSTLFGRTYLNDFLGSFSAGGYTWTGTLSSVVRFVPAPPAEGSFLVYGNTPVSVLGPEGNCGEAVRWLDSILGNLDTVPAAQGFDQSYCGGESGSYQMETPATGDHQLTFVDLGSPGNEELLKGLGAAAYRAQRETVWEVLAQRLDLSSEAPFVNPASLTPDLAPGGLMRISGEGLRGGASDTVVEFDGESLPIVALDAFRITVLLPNAAVAGEHTVKVTSPNGSATSAVTLLDTAPALFESPDHRGVIFDSRGALITPDNPAIRGQRVRAYGTGLGLVNGQALDVPVSAEVGGRAISASFSGMADGLLGVYMVDMVLPDDLAPSESVSVRLLQGGRVSNSVEITVQ